MVIDFNHHSMSTKLMKPLLVLIVCTLFMCNTLDSNYLWLVSLCIQVTCAVFKESNSSTSSTCEDWSLPSHPLFPTSRGQPLSTLWTDYCRVYCHTSYNALPVHFWISDPRGLRMDVPLRKMGHKALSLLTSCRTCHTFYAHHPDVIAV